MKLTIALCYLLAAHLVALQVVEAQDEAGEEAPYTVVKEAEGYEERAYPASPWVCHTNTISDEGGRTNSFWPLFRYITGNNNKNTDIPMTAPVTTRLQQNGEAWDSQMCFYIPKAHQQNPPEPADEAVKVVNRPAMNVFARRVGGNLTSSEWKNLRDELKTLLETNEPSADLSFYYTAGYDSPRKATNRRNEVWYEKK
ncbi:heme-binding protein 1-like [Eriocheir sinensis]|uniref:heme-binding protein 1-like n=1 Tax=Eriocheir sinensis TaxID=95602 RepID=UPI0021C990D3|nr:heme-binding protein 1-like [Eriocheir sinensis]